MININYIGKELLETGLIKKTFELYMHKKKSFKTFKILE